MGGFATTNVAQSTPLENRDDRDNDFKSINVQDGLEEIDFRRETLEPTGFQNLTDSIVSFDKTTREVKVEPTGSSFDYYIFGEKFTKTAAETLIIPNTTGLHIAYFDNVGTGQFVSYTGGPSADKPYDGNEIKVCIVYWNATQADGIFFGDARSLLSMPWALQRRSHFVTRTEFGVSDFLIQNETFGGDGTLDDHARFGFSMGSVYHEDAKFEVVDTPTPVNYFEQDLGIIARVPIYYRQGTGNQWFKKTSNGFPLYDDPGNNIFYNKETAGVWSLENAADNEFVTVYFFASINVNEPIIGILGDHAGSSPQQSVHPHMISPKGFPVPATGFIKAVIFQTSSSFTNTPRARIFAVSDVLDTLSADRYAISMNYGGNANNGRWLETSPGQSSDDQAVLVPEDSFVRTVTLQSTATIGVGKSIGFYKTTDLATPVFILTTTNGGNSEQFEVTEFFNKGDEIAIKVINGSINKPFVRFWIETTL